MLIQQGIDHIATNSFTHLISFVTGTPSVRFEAPEYCILKIAAQMLTQEWAEPKDAEHRLFHAASDIKDKDGHALVTAYAVLRPDGQWSLMLINKDYDNLHTVGIQFHDDDAKDDAKKNRSFTGPVARITFGKEQYTWHPALRDGYADSDGPAARSTLPAGTDQFTLPAASMTVLRGRVD